MINGHTKSGKLSEIIINGECLQVWVSSHELENKDFVWSDEEGWVSKAWKERMDKVNFSS